MKIAVTMRPNKHANKRTIYWPPFWNKMFSILPNVLFSSSLTITSTCAQQRFMENKLVK